MTKQKMNKRPSEQKHCLMYLFVLGTTSVPNAYRVELTPYFVNLFLEMRWRQTKVTTSRRACRNLVLIILPVPAAS